MKQDPPDLHRYKAPEKPSIKEQLKKNLPEYFQKSPFSFISYLPNQKILLRENLTIEEKAQFIKTYHDLVDEKYKEIQLQKKTTLEECNKIQSHKKNTLEAHKFLKAKKGTDKDYKTELKRLDKELERLDKEFERLDNKELGVFKELKELDSEVNKILKPSDFQELNQKLFELDNHKYPTSEIFGQNAIRSRKKSSIAMTGEEFFKFSVLSDLIKVERKIKDAEEKNEKNKQPKQTEQSEQPKKLKTIEEIEKGELLKTIKNIDKSKEFKFFAKDLKIFLDLERNKLKDPSKKTSKEDPLSILKRVIDDSKELFKTGTPKKDEKLFKNLSNLIKEEDKKTLNSQQKQRTSQKTQDSPPRPETTRRKQLGASPPPPAHAPAKFIPHSSSKNPQNNFNGEIIGTSLICASALGLGIIYMPAITAVVAVTAVGVAGIFVAKAIATNINEQNQDNQNSPKK